MTTTAFVRLKNSIKRVTFPKFVKRDSLFISLIEYRREFLAKKTLSTLSKSKNLEVSYGVFSGLRLSHPPANVSSIELLQKKMGIYEQQILKIIDSQLWVKVIVLGAADGYYGLGGLKRSLFKEVIFFEQNPSLVRTIVENARLNDLSENCFKIFGSVSRENLVSLLDNFEESRMFCNLLISDIEGFEYYLFSDQIFRTLSDNNFHLILELHDTSGAIRDTFLGTLSKFYTFTQLDSFSRNVSHLQEAFHLYDSWIVAAETRGNNFLFIYCVPKKISAT